MGVLYSSVPAAVAAGTACNLQIPFSFSLPSISFPPPIPFPDLSIELPSIPLYCPLD